MNWQYKTIIDRLRSLRDFNDFFIHYVQNESHETNIKILIDKYRKYCTSNSISLTQSEDFLLEEIKDRLLEISYRENNNLLFYLSGRRNMDGKEIDKFRVAWENAKTGRFSFKLRDRQSYKTVREYFYLHEYEDNEILEAYRNSKHPLITQVIGSSFVNGGFYSKGVPLIIKGALLANNPNNPYWHSMYGMFGCTLSLWEFIRLYGLSKFKEKYDSHYKNLVKLLYLYLSRSIAICETKTAAQGHDFYRNRADLQRDNYTIMMAIFADYDFFATNMDIQFMADCQLAFMLCSKCGVPNLAEQSYWDSFKMYRYSSLSYFNEDNGIKEIEDDTFFELVERGRVRANIVAEKVLEEYIIGKIRIPEYIFEEMFVDIMNNNPDSPEDIEWHK